MEFGSYFYYDLLENEDDGYTLVIYLDTYINMEFSNEFLSEDRGSLQKQIGEFIKRQFPNLKITTIKLVIGTALITTIPAHKVLAVTPTTTTNYTNYIVKSGDSLWKIANQFGVTINDIKQVNSLTSDMLYVGQTLSIPSTNENIRVVINGQEQYFDPAPLIIEGTTYLPLRQIANHLGASVWYNGESNTVGINRGDTRIAFFLGSSVARVNGVQVNVPPAKVINNLTYVPVRFISQTFGLTVDWDSTTKTVTISDLIPTTYTVVSGDTLWMIANKFDTTVIDIKTLNNLTTDTIYVGQEIQIPIKLPAVEKTLPPAPDLSSPAPDPNQTDPTISYITHTVESGDNAWNLSIQYGIPQQEVLDANNLTSSSVLQIGQKLRIPVHHVPVKPTVSDRHGELLDWWTEAQYVFSIGKTAKVTDFQTGRTFQIKRTIGAFHADSEPLTSDDAAIMKEIWGGNYSWTARAVIIEIDGRRLAASMTSMPHDIEYIKDNNYNGHFDVHFLNSTRHSDNQINEEHQRQIKIAAGVS